MSVQYGGDKITFSDGSTVGSGWSGFKNRIINGAMMIDQRNAGAATANTINGYTLDRWAVLQSTTGKLIAQQNAGSVTPPVGFTNYLGVTSQSAYSVGSGDYYQIQQSIEGFNAADLGFGTANAKTVTISFWVRSSLTGSFPLNLRNAAGNRWYPTLYTISAANTWEYKTVTIAGDTSGTWNTTNDIGIGVVFGLGYGSSINGTIDAWGTTGGGTGSTSVVGTNGATFYITGVQLEKGSTATSFDYRPYGTELALCQRYYETSNATDRLAYMPFNAYNSGSTYGHWIYRVQKRVAPTVTFNGSYWRIYENSNLLTSTGTAATDGIGLNNVCVTLSGATFNVSYGQFSDNRELNAIKIDAEL